MINTHETHAGYGPKMLDLNIMSHGPEKRGDRSATFDDVCAVHTPQATPSWRPVAHGRMIETLERAANAYRANIVQAKHLLGRDGQRYFGLFQVNIPSRGGDVASVLGLRNSHDKAFRAGIMAGDAPFVCSNLCFHNEIVLGRKHTAGMSMIVLENLMLEAMQRLIEARSIIDDRNDRLKEIRMNDSQAHDVIIKAARAGACAPTHVAKVAEQWHKPEHAEFAGSKTAWRLQNAFSNVWRGTPQHTPQRSAALHNVMNDQLPCV